MNFCPYCERKAVLTSGDLIYPHRPDLHDKSFWACEPCKAWVGCHPGTTKSLGRLANADLRKAKSKAHALFDPLWKDGLMRRKEAYRLLASKLGIEPKDCHIGMFDLEMCNRAIAVFKPMSQATPPNSEEL